MLDLRKLRGLRVQKDLTQEEMSKLLGISLSSYQRKENGDTQFNLNEAHKISEILKTPLTEIFFTY